VWDTTSGKLVCELRGHTDEVNSAEFSPDETGKFVVTASKDGTAHVWDARTGEVLASRPTGPEQQGAIETSTLAHNGPVTSARFSPNGKYIVTTSGSKAFLWAPETAGQWAKTSDESPTILKGHEDVVTNAVFSPDSKWVVTISQDRTARVWQAMTLPNTVLGLGAAGPLAHEPGSAESVAIFRGHIKPITSVAISKDSKYVVTGSEDKTARAWDLTRVGVFSVAAPVLKAETAEYSGKCPFTFQFTGSISVAGKGGIVKYKFLRSDKALSLPQELVFDGPGSKAVSTTWQLSPIVVDRGGNQIPFEGWQQIEILEPVAMKSERASFKLTCDKAGEQQTIAPELTLDQLARIMPNAKPADRELYLPYIQKAMDEFGINTAQRQAEFLAELAHETAELSHLQEDPRFGQSYEYRKDLGNIEPGDGPKFIGRGGFQVTGRTNYKKFGEQLGIDLIANPEKAATPEVAFRVAGATWQSFGLNEVADQSNTTYIRRRLTGGLNGLDRVTVYVTRARQVLGVPAAP
jgi:predicted chitinase